MKRYKYTIIIPHKNTPELLQRCLDSIPQRDDLQVIIVDDNSDSKVVDFNHFPGKEEPNIELYFDKTGRGAGHARNVGLDHAGGEWILFSDSDDYFHTENLNRLFDGEFDSFDVVAWLCVRLIERREELYVDFGAENDNPEILYRIYEPWRKMIRLSLIKEHNIRFQETMVSNDLYFSKRVAYHCKQFYFFNDIIYYWQIRNNSLSSKYYGKRLVSALEVSIFVNKYLIGIGKEKYHDRTRYYMNLLLKESPILFCFYLLKITIIWGCAFFMRSVKNLSE